ncbi:hypothetical protein Tco_0611481 [Tanacetum coccineum]
MGGTSPFRVQDEFRSHVADNFNDPVSDLEAGSHFRRKYYAKLFGDWREQISQMAFLDSREEPFGSFFVHSHNGVLFIFFQNRADEAVFYTGMSINLKKSHILGLGIRVRVRFVSEAAESSLGCSVDED